SFPCRRNYTLSSFPRTRESSRSVLDTRLRGYDGVFFQACGGILFRWHAGTLLLSATVPTSLTSACADSVQAGASLPSSFPRNRNLLPSSFPHKRKSHPFVIPAYAGIQPVWSGYPLARA